jgi:hypothetical protein
LITLRGLCDSHSPRSLSTSDRGIGRLRSRCGRHPLTRFRTPSTQLDALLKQLIVSCHWQAVLSALPTQLGTEPANPIVERRLPQHVVDGGCAHLRTVHQHANAVGRRMSPTQLQAMCDGLRTQRMAVSAELNARPHLIVSMMPSLHWHRLRIRPAS